MDKYVAAAKRALKWLENQLQDDGRISGMPCDLACYYKAPSFLMQHGRRDSAEAVLDFIQTHFMQSNGDFLSSKDHKSANPAFVEFWNYPNGWIAQAAQRMGRFDISYPAWKYLQIYFNPQLGGWHTHRMPDLENPVDILSTAHLGLASLHFGDKEKAQKAGDFLQKVFLKQSEQSAKFYLRIGKNNELIKNYPKEMAIFESVDQYQPNQAYFMIGYPLAFLTKLFQATQDSKYLETAKHYFEWIEQCSGNLRTFFFSHKVAWGASCLAEITNDVRARELSQTIADYLISIQDDSGAWLSTQDALTMCDQTVEIAIWLTEIATTNKYSLSKFI